MNAGWVHTTSLPDWAAVPGRANIVLVDGVGCGPTLPASLAAVVLAAGSTDTDSPAWCDAVCGDSDIEAIERDVTATPIAATALVQVLRGAEGRSMSDGLLIESAVYSALQAGPEFARWRSSRPRRARSDPDETVLEIGRDGDTLLLSLNRPHVHNALNAALRDALLDALALPLLDTSVTVHLRGNGRSYSTGGDLEEFGSFGDPASAHLVRTATAIGPALAALGERLTVTVHGSCAGSGIELPAFAQRVVARPDLSAWLPELSLGLIPGAGGTWSLPHRIGRHRTAWLALTGNRIGQDTALAWGLVDARP
jgi:hypothetical protein